MLRAGARVTLMGRDAERLDMQREKCRALGDVACISVDVTQEDSVANAFRRAPGAVDILVNNAGQAQAAPFTHTDMALWQRMLDVNLTGVFLGTRAVLPGMLERGHGRIVNVASTAGQIGYAYVAAYCAAKHGVIGLTRSLALEVATKGITVNAVCPGYTETELLHAVARTDHQQDLAHRTEARETLLRSNPQRRFVTPEQVANAVLVAVPTRLGRHHGASHFHLRWRSNVTKSSNIKKPAAAAETKPQRKGVPEPAENVVDLEMSTGADSHMGLRLWLRMLTTTNLVQAELRKRLRNEFDTTLPRFDLMAQLERHPEGLKMTELSRRLMVTGGNVTGITDQLEKEGLVVARQRSERPPLDQRAADTGGPQGVRQDGGRARAMGRRTVRRFEPR